MTTGSCRPWPDVPWATATAAHRRTPGTAVIWRCAAGVIPGPTAGAVTTASAPATCQDAATSALATALRAMPANAITANARTSANAGSTPACAAARPRAKPTSSTTPRRRRAQPGQLAQQHRVAPHDQQGDRDRDEHRGRAGEQVHLAGRGQALLAEQDQAADRSEDQGSVGHPAPRGRDPARAGAGPAARAARGALLPRRQHGWSRQRGQDDQARQPPGQRRGGPRGHRDGGAHPEGGGRQGRGGPAAQRQGADLAERGAAGPHHRELAAAAGCHQPGAEQDHHGRDHGQADEHQREHALNRVVGGHERRQRGSQAAAQAHLDGGSRARGGVEAGAHRCRGGQVTDRGQRPGPGPPPDRR